MLGLFIVFQGLTGAVSQYRFWLLGVSDSAYAVDASGPEASPGEVLAIVEREIPGFEAAHVMYPAANAPDTAVMVMGGTDPAQRMARLVTLDQYNGNVMENRSLQSGAGWIGLANTLHKWTIFGTTGRVILTLVGLGAVALAILGLVLWWKTRKVRAPSMLAKLHRSAGLAVATLFLPIALAGTALNLLTWYEREADKLVTSANMREAMALDRRLDISVPVDEAFETARSAIGPQRLAAFSPAGAHARYHWFAFNSSQLRRTDVLVDPETGEIAGIKPAGLIEGGEGVRHWLYPLHTMYVFGPIGGALATIMALSLVFWLVSGIVIWRRGKRNARTPAL